jgi:DNA-binding transcriptional ArsR family regulator
VTRTVADLPGRETPPVIDAAYYKALSHPLRQRLLFALGRGPATISQLARALEVAKGSVIHHLKVLQNGGLVEAAGTKQVRGGTEHYYQRVAGPIIMPGNPAGAGAAMLSAVAHEIAAAPGDPLLALRHVRLTAATARRLTATLEELLHDVTDEPDASKRYGVLVAMFREAPAPSGN